MSHKVDRFDLKDKSSQYYGYARREMLEFVPPGAKRILDVGCSDGSFGEELKKTLGAEVWGVEIDAASAAAAEKKLDRVLTGGIEAVMDAIPDRYFDCVTFNDVLEHLVDPYDVLLKMKTKMTGSGVIACSLPNIRYHKVLRDLVLRKQWRYTDEGILDKTHLRFFTRDSMADMFTGLGFEILTLRGMHKTRSRNFRLLNMLLFNFLDDARYAKYACVIRAI